MKKVKLHIINYDVSGLTNLDLQSSEFLDFCNNVWNRFITIIYIVCGAVQSYELLKVHNV